jgi:hypothetical protein
MSDREVCASIEQMEAWLADPAWDPDGDALAEWNQAFLAAVATAERGPGWEELMIRAHALPKELERRTAQLEVRRDALKRELDGQAVGTRALKGYGASIR